MQDLRYLGLKMFDVPQTNIAKYFDEANDFIEEAVAGNGEKLGTVMISGLYTNPGLRTSPGPLPHGNVSKCNTSPRFSGQKERYGSYRSFEIGG